MFRCLSLNANLTNDNGYPVANETVSFYTRPINGKSRLTDGWIPIGSAKTNDVGYAILNTAFKVPDGNYSFRIYHEGNENFGESENVTEIPISSEIEGLSLGWEFSVRDGFASSAFDDLTITVSSHNPYALLQMNATAQYVVDEPLQGAYVCIVFFCDHMNLTGYLGTSDTTFSEGQGGTYVYKGTLNWSPDVVGHHKLIAGVVNGTITDVVAGMHGIGIRAFGEVNLEIQPNPTNLVVNYQYAMYGSVFPFSVSFSMPRAYNTVSTDFCKVNTLAPAFVYNGVDYMVDIGVESANAKLYLNDILIDERETDENGLATLAVPLSFPGNYLTVDATLVVRRDLYQEQEVSLPITFTKISVNDSPTEVSNIFVLNYSVNTLHHDGRIYTGCENAVETRISLFDTPVWRMPVHVLAGELVACTGTYRSERISLGYQSPWFNYLRITHVCDADDPVRADVNRDGIVDVLDLVIVTSFYGRWDLKADVNYDGVVNILDITTVSTAYGERVHYLEILDLSVLDVTFESGQQVSADRQGCCGKGPGLWFDLSIDGQPVGGAVEFIHLELNTICYSNSIGGAKAIWKPESDGTHFVQVKLPSNFNLIVGEMCETTEIDTSLNLIGYFLVEKSPIDVFVTYTPEEPTLDDLVTMTVKVFDLGLGEPKRYVTVDYYVYDMQSNWIYMGFSEAGSDGVATFKWVPRDYLERCGNFSNFVLWCKVFDFPPHIPFRTLLAEKVPINVDTRYPTKLEFLMGGDSVSVAVGAQFELRVELTRADDGSPVSGVWVDLYVDGVKKAPSLTNADGIASWWPHVVEEKGTYYYSACFEQYNNLYEPSEEARLVVVAEVVPMYVMLDVQPREFKPGTSLTLSAQVNDSRTNMPLEGYTVRFYAVDEAGVKAWIGQDETNSDGVAELKNWIYAVGPYAFTVEVATGQTLISNPIMLTVAKETVLRLDVSKDESSFNHTISGRLLSYGEPVYRQVKILVNDTVRAILGTNHPDGSFNLTLSLQPKDNKPTTYNIQAVFEGDEPRNATAYALTSNKTNHASAPNPIRLRTTPHTSTIFGSKYRGLSALHAHTDA